VSPAVQAFFRACHAQQNDIDGASPKFYKFGEEVIRGLRVFLINLDHDEEQENFFLDIMNHSTLFTVGLEAHYVDHLKEYLKGVPDGLGN
jgi:hypothetical protein